MVWENLLRKWGCFPLWTAEFNSCCLLQHFLLYDQCPHLSTRLWSWMVGWAQTRDPEFILFRQTTGIFFFSPLSPPFGGLWFHFSRQQETVILKRSKGSLLLTAMGNCGHHKSMQMCSSALGVGSASFWDLVRPSCQSCIHVMFWFMGSSCLWRLQCLYVVCLQSGRGSLYIKVQWLRTASKTECNNYAKYLLWLCSG